TAGPLEPVLVARVTHRRLHLEAQRFALPTATRRPAGVRAHRVEPVHRVSVLPRIPAEHAVTAIGNLSVPLLTVLADHEHPFEIQARFEEALCRPTLGIPRRRMHLLVALPRADEGAKALVLWRWLGHFHGGPPRLPPLARSPTEGTPFMIVPTPLGERQ